MNMHEIPDNYNSIYFGDAVSPLLAMTMVDGIRNVLENEPLKMVAT